ncbi:MAG: hypothetical protein AAFQ63_15700 [Cyanobacteria bacterium J06621_11]
MDIQVVKISLTTEESAEALPVVMQALATMPQSSSHDIELETQILAPMQSVAAGHLPEAFQPPSDIQPSHSVQPAAPKLETDSPTDIPKQKISIAPPTGHRRRLKTMIYDPAQQRYRRRTLIDQLIQIIDRGEQWCEAHQRAISIVVGSSVGLGVITISVLFNYPPFLFNRFSNVPDPSAQIEETESTDTKSTDTNSDSAPTTPTHSNNNPADASDKAGQPDKLPLSEGAIK